MKANATQSLLLPQRLSLMAQTVQSLREGIRAGHWRSHLPGERELCAHLQVGRNTLRAALNELQRKGWLEVVQGQRRRIKSMGTRGAANIRKRVVAVLSPSAFLAMSPAGMFLIDALRDRLTQAGCEVEFHVNRACFSERPARALEKLVRDHPATVWLLSVSKEPMQRWFIQRQLPCLVMGSCRRDIPLLSVDADYLAACRHAGGVLLRKGHKHVALVLPRGAYGGDADSEKGLREALADTPATRLHVLRHDGSASHLCSLLDEALRLPNPPTAYLVARTIHVLTVMMHLMRRGKRIPQDAAIISRDDDPLLQSATLDVARYSVNLGRFARRVSTAARQLAETGALPAHAIRLTPQFFPGETI